MKAIRNLATAALLALAPLSVWAAANASASASVSVPVLKQSVQKGDIIAADNLVMDTVSASEVFASTVTEKDELAGMQAVRSLPANRPINRLHIKVAPDVERGAAVTLRFVKGGVELTSKGQALEEGRIGQSIRVLNPNTRTTLVGTVQPSGVVQVN